MVFMIRLVWIRNSCNWIDRSNEKEIDQGSKEVDEDRQNKYVF